MAMTVLSAPPTPGPFRLIARTSLFRTKVVSGIKVFMVHRRSWQSPSDVRAYRNRADLIASISV